MPFEPNEYQRKIMVGRRLIASRTNRRLQRSIIEAWIREMRSITRLLAAGDISPQTADRLRRQIIASVQRWAEGVDGLTKRFSNEAISGLRRLHEELIKKTAGDLDVSVTFSMEGFNAEALEGMFVRRGIDIASSFKTLQNTSIASQLAGPVSDAIEEGIRSGDVLDTSRRIARLLALDDAPDIDRLRAIAHQQGVSLAELIEARIDGFDGLPGLKEAVKRQMFNARRIAQTELDVAAHEAERVAAVRNPIVKALRWRTSTRHRTLSSAPDVCDVLEQYDFHGLGEGLYFPRTLPSKPHPFDGCTRLYEFRNTSEWENPKPSPGRPAMVNATQVRTILASNVRTGSRRITPNFVARTTALANRYVQLAWISYQTQQKQIA